MPGGIMPVSSFRNVADQRGEAIPEFVQVRGEAILAASLPQSLQRGVRPTVAFPAHRGKNGEE